MSGGVYDALGPLSCGEAALEHCLVTTCLGACPCVGGWSIVLCGEDPSPGVSLCFSREGRLGLVWAEGLKEPAAHSGHTLSAFLQGTASVS